MLAFLTRLVALTAFVAHVLLGCCSHHGHASLHQSCCDEYSKSGIEPNVYPGKVHGTQDCRHCSDVCLVLRESDVESICLIDQTLPVDPSDQCDHGRCIYNLTVGTLIPEASTFVVDILFLSDSPKLLAMTCGNRFSIASFTQGSVESVGLRCALFNSWQL